jgi:hypothetical protein
MKIAPVHVAVYVEDEQRCGYWCETLPALIAAFRRAMRFIDMHAPPGDYLPGAVRVVVE